MIGQIHIYVTIRNIRIIGLADISVRMENTLQINK